MSSLALTLGLALLAAPEPTISSSTGGAAEIQQVVERALEEYTTAKSYEDTLVITSEIQAEPPLDVPEPFETTLAFVRPGKLAVQNDIYQVITEGRRLWEAVDVWMQYSESAAPDALKLGSLSLNRFSFFREGRHPLLPLILDGDRSGLNVLSDKARLTTIRSESLDGKPGQRLCGTMGPEDIEIWFDDATGLIGEIAYDQTKAAQVSTPGMKIRKLVQRLSFKNVRINQPIADERFTFTPGLYMDKVDALRMPSSQELQQRLTGKPAPLFEGKYLDGKPVRADEFKGRVVLLSFWSLRCGPCIMSMPVLQKLADKYADKGVSVVGVNLDGPSASPGVLEMIRNRKVSYRQLIETQPNLAEKYFIEGIPCMALIDGKGTIQSIRLGMADERELSRMIDRVLDGQDLFVR